MNDGYVPIPKDLKKVKTKVAFNLTRRQLIGFTLNSFCPLELQPTKVSINTRIQKQDSIFS